MRVCLLNDSFPPIIDGVANVVMNYANILTARGHEVVVGTPKYPDVDYSNYPYKVVPYQSFDTTAYTDGYRTGVPLDMDALGVLRDFNPDIIHVHSPMSAMYLGRNLASVCKAPLVYTYHTKYDLDIEREIKAQILQKEAIKAIVDNISMADVVYAVSQGAGDNLCELGYKGEFMVLENGVDFPKGEVDEETVRSVTAPFDLPSNLPVYLFVGRMVNYKGLPIIQEALEAISDVGYDFRMVYIGGGADAQELKDRALSAGFAVDVYTTEKDGPGHVSCLGRNSKRPGKIIFTGPIRDRDTLRAWNTRADLFLFPSTFDTNGLVVREAAACALASVLIRQSCAAEGVQNEKNGYIIEEKASSLAALLVKLHDKKDEMHEVGIRAMEELYLSWDSSLDYVIGEYERIIKARKEGTLPARNDYGKGKLLGFALNVTTGTKNIFAGQHEGHERTLIDPSTLIYRMRSWFDE